MKTIVITGATSGIGFAVAEEMCARGWNVIGIGHSGEKCEIEYSSLDYPAYSIIFRYFMKKIRTRF